MSVFCPRNWLSVTVTTRGQSYNFAKFVCTSQQTQRMLSPLTSALYEKIVTVHQNVGLQAFVEEVARRSHALGKSSLLQNLSIVFSPTLGSIQRTVHRLSQFSTYAWLLCLGVVAWQSDEDVANCISVEVCSAHMQHKKNAELPAEVLPRRSARPLYGALPYTPDANVIVGLRRFLCGYRST